MHRSFSMALSCLFTSRFFDSCALVHVHKQREESLLRRSPHFERFRLFRGPLIVALGKSKGQNASFNTSLSVIWSAFCFDGLRQLHDDQVEEAGRIASFLSTLFPSPSISGSPNSCTPDTRGVHGRRFSMCICQWSHAQTLRRMGLVAAPSTLERLVLGKKAKAYKLSGKETLITVLKVDSRTPIVVTLKLGDIRFVRVSNGGRG